MRGSGKTMLAIQLLLDKAAYRGHFDKIYIVSPTFADQFKEWSRIAPEGVSVYTETISDKIVDAITSDIQSQPTPCRSLIIFDDNSDMIHKQARESKLKLLVNNGRHLGGGQSAGGGVSMWFLLQRLSQCPTWIRGQSTAVLSAASLALRERQIYWAECSVMDKKTFFGLLEESTQEQYSFMACVFLNGVLRYFRIIARPKHIEWEELNTQTKNISLKR